MSSRNTVNAPSPFARIELNHGDRRGACDYSEAVI
jgi:hypothetical protein